MNWDDLKYFLAVCRTGSIRAAAIELGVNHATVSRRINSFEASLGERLFERSAKGYRCTALGDEIFVESSQLEQCLKSIERRVAGKDNTMVGDIRVTLPDILAERLLMPDFADFCEQYPEIQLEIIDSTRALNLANREADVAFRLCDTPPDYLIGRKLANIHRSCYIAKKLYPKLHEDGWLEQQNWLGWTDKLRRPIGKIAREYPRLDSKHKIINAALQIEACKNGMGVGILPCFCADNDDELVRIPPYIAVPRYDLWILSHPDMRHNAKIQCFVRFMVERITQKRPLIEGELFTLPD
ncbi:MAG: LysR family transcriptional regulator [Pseudomonadales bacterium]|nr:LysR family transcriptional regulator [Pseudomonadales bacterium]